MLEDFPARRGRLKNTMSSVIRMCWWSYLLLVKSLLGTSQMGLPKVD